MSFGPALPLGLRPRGRRVSGCGVPACPPRPQPRVQRNPLARRALLWLFWALPAPVFRAVTCLGSRDLRFCCSTAASSRLWGPSRPLGAESGSLSGAASPPPLRPADSAGDPTRRPSTPAVPTADRRIFPPPRGELEGPAGSLGEAALGSCRLRPRSPAPTPTPARRACGFSASLERAGFCRPGAACLPPAPVPRFPAFRASAGFWKLRSLLRREGQGREGGRVKGVLSPGLGRLGVRVVQGPRWPPWGTFSRRRRGRWGWARLIPGSSLARTESVFTWAQPVRIARVCSCSTASDVEVTSKLTKVIGILE